MNFNFQKLFPAVIILILSMTLAAQTGKISGVITDAETGDPLPGANVVVGEDNPIGAASNIDGEYMITGVPTGTYKMIVTYIGYQKTERQVTVEPGELTIVDIQLRHQSLRGEDVVVTAQARGQTEAMNQQISSDVIKNIVSSSKIHELPDENAATALSRLPGVSLMEGDKAVIRGIQAKQNLVLVNGIQLPSTDMQDRSTNLGFISSNMLSGIEVTKAISPDMDASAIGGVINLRLREAPEGLHFELRAEGIYNTQDNTSIDKNNKIWGSISNRFFDNKLGVFLQGNYSRSNAGNEFAQATYEPKGPGAGNPYGEATYGMQDFYYSDEVNIVENYGGSLLLDYDLPNGSIKLQNTLAYTDNALARHRDLLKLARTQRWFTLKRDIHEKQLIINALQGNNNIGNLNVKYGIAHSYSEKETDLRYGDPEFELAFFNSQTDEIPFRDFNEGDLLSLTHDSIYALEMNEEDWRDATLQENLDTKNENFTHHHYDANLDLSFPFKISDLINAKFKAGGRISIDERENDVYRTHVRGSEQSYSNNQKMIELYQRMGADTSQLNIAHLTDFRDENYERGEYLEGKYGMDVVLDEDYMDSFFRYAPNSWSGAGKHWTDSNKDDFNGSETVSAAYLMANFDIGPKLTLLTGVRYENWNMDYEANFIFETHGIDGTGFEVDTLNTVDRDVPVWFPNLQLKYDITDWLDARLAYTKTISRPDYKAILPNIFMENTSLGQAGNPTLEPAISQNFDAYFSFHNDRIGLFTIGGFYKKIKNKFFQIDRLYRALPEGVTYPDTSVIDAIPNIYNYPEASATITTYMNNPEPAYLHGIEFEWQTNFWYLPKPFNYLVFDINYTRIWSEMDYKQIHSKDSTIYTPRPEKVIYEVDTLRTARLVHQGDHILNIALGADYKGFSGRLSFRMQGDVITEVGVRPEEDRYTGNIYNWDFTIQQDLPIEGLSLSLSGMNFMHSPTEEYQKFRRETGGKIKDNLTQIRYEPRRLQVGLRYSF
ncbi:MAG: TonB-dependent receptor [Candidatus Marinimicrobia bacterium]|nr:TonB-dependent receptor [Candidatus Neomarinimicrobiota bacterium]